MCCVVVYHISSAQMSPHTSSIMEYFTGNEVDIKKTENSLLSLHTTDYRGEVYSHSFQVANSLGHGVGGLSRSSPLRAIDQ